MARGLIEEAKEEVWGAIEGVRAALVGGGGSEGWKERFEEAFEKGLMRWEEAEGELLRRRMAWEREAGERWEEGEEEWEAVWEELYAERERWVKEVERVREEGEAKWGERWGELEELEREVRARMEEEVGERAEAYSDRVGQLVGLVGDAVAMREMARENWEWWMERLGVSEEKVRVVEEGVEAMKGAMEEGYKRWKGELVKMPWSTLPLGEVWEAVRGEAGAAGVWAGVEEWGVGRYGEGAREGVRADIERALEGRLREVERWEVVVEVYEAFGEWVGGLPEAHKYAGARDVLEGGSRALAEAGWWLGKWEMCAGYEEEGRRGLEEVYGEAVGVDEVGAEVWGEDAVDRWEDVYLSRWEREVVKAELEEAWWAREVEVWEAVCAYAEEVGGGGAEREAETRAAYDAAKAGYEEALEAYRVAERVLVEAKAARAEAGAEVGGKKAAYEEARRELEGVVKAYEEFLATLEVKDVAWQRERFRAGYRRLLELRGLVEGKGVKEAGDAYYEAAAERWWWEKWKGVHGVLERLVGAYEGCEGEVVWDPFGKKVEKVEEVGKGDVEGVVGKPAWEWVDEVGVGWGMERGSGEWEMLEAAVGRWWDACDEAVADGEVTDEEKGKIAAAMEGVAAVREMWEREREGEKEVVGALLRVAVEGGDAGGEVVPGVEEAERAYWEARLEAEAELLGGLVGAYRAAVGGGKGPEDAFEEACEGVEAWLGEWARRYWEEEKEGYRDEETGKYERDAFMEDLEAHVAKVEDLLAIYRGEGGDRGELSEWAKWERYRRGGSILEGEGGEDLLLLHVGEVAEAKGVWRAAARWEGVREEVEAWGGEGGVWDAARAKVREVGEEEGLWHGEEGRWKRVEELWGEWEGGEVPWAEEGLAVHLGKLRAVVEEVAGELPGYEEEGLREWLEGYERYAVAYEARMRGGDAGEEPVYGEGDERVEGEAAVEALRGEVEELWERYEEVVDEGVGEGVRAAYLWGEEAVPEEVYAYLAGEVRAAGGWDAWVDEETAVVDEEARAYVEGVWEGWREKIEEAMEEQEGEVEEAKGDLRWLFTNEESLEEWVRGVADEVGRMAALLRLEGWDGEESVEKYATGNEVIDEAIGEVVDEWEDVKGAYYEKESGTYDVAGFLADRWEEVVGEVEEAVPAWGTGHEALWEAACGKAVWDLCTAVEGWSRWEDKVAEAWGVGDEVAGEEGWYEVYRKGGYGAYYLLREVVVRGRRWTEVEGAYKGAVDEVGEGGVRVAALIDAVRGYVPGADGALGTYLSGLGFGEEEVAAAEVWWEEGVWPGEVGLWYARSEGEVEEVVGKRVEVAYEREKGRAVEGLKVRCEEGRDRLREGERWVEVVRKLEAAAEEGNLRQYLVEALVDDDPGETPEGGEEDEAYDVTPDPLGEDLSEPGEGLGYTADADCGVVAEAAWAYREGVWAYEAARAQGDGIGGAYWEAVKGEVEEVRRGEREGLTGYEELVGEGSGYVVAEEEAQGTYLGMRGEERAVVEDLRAKGEVCFLAGEGGAIVEDDPEVAAKKASYEEAMEGAEAEVRDAKAAWEAAVTGYVAAVEDYEKAYEGAKAAYEALEEAKWALRKAKAVVEYAESRYLEEGVASGDEGAADLYGLVDPDDRLAYAKGMEARAGEVASALREGLEGQREQDVVEEEWERYEEAFRMQVAAVRLAELVEDASTYVRAKRAEAERALKKALAEIQIRDVNAGGAEGKGFGHVGLTEEEKKRLATEVEAGEMFSEYEETLRRWASWYVGRGVGVKDVRGYIRAVVWEELAGRVEGGTWELFWEYTPGAYEQAVAKLRSLKYNSEYQSMNPTGWESEYEETKRQVEMLKPYYEAYSEVWEEMKEVFGSGFHEKKAERYGDARGLAEDLRDAYERVHEEEWYWVFKALVLYSGELDLEGYKQWETYGHVEYPGGKKGGDEIRAGFEEKERRGEQWFTDSVAGLRDALEAIVTADKEYEGWVARAGALSGAEGLEAVLEALWEMDEYRDDVEAMGELVGVEVKDESWCGDLVSVLLEGTPDDWEADTSLVGRLRSFWEAEVGEAKVAYRQAVGSVAGDEAAEWGEVGEAWRAYVAGGGDVAYEDLELLEVVEEGAEGQAVMEAVRSYLEAKEGVLGMREGYLLKAYLEWERAGGEVERTEEEREAFEEKVEGWKEGAPRWLREAIEQWEEGQKAGGDDEERREIRAGKEAEVVGIVGAMRREAVVREAWEEAKERVRGMGKGQEKVALLREAALYRELRDEVAGMGGEVHRVVLGALGEVGGVIEQARMGGFMEVWGEQWGQLVRGVEEERKVGEKQMEAIVSRGMMAFRKGAAMVKAAQREWEEAYEAAYEEKREEWDRHYLAFVEAQKEWVEDAGRKVVQAESEAVCMALGERAEEAIAAVLSFVVADIGLPTGVEEVREELYGTIIDREYLAGLVELGQRWTERSGEEALVVWAHVADEYSSGEVMELVARYVEEKYEGLEEHLATLAYEQAKEQLEEAKAQLEEQVEKANEQVGEGIERMFLSEGFRKEGRKWVKKTLIGSTLWEDLYEWHRVEDYRPYRTEVKDIVAEFEQMVEGGGVDADGDGRVGAGAVQVYVRQMMDVLKGEQERIFGTGAVRYVKQAEEEWREQGGRPWWGLLMGGGMAAGSPWTMVVHREVVEEEVDEGAYEAYQELVEDGDADGSWRVLEIRDGEFNEYVGYAPVMKSGEEVDLGVGVGEWEKNVRLPGAGEMGRIMGWFSMHKMLEAKGEAEARAPWWDKKLWDDRGTWIKAPNLRAVVDLGVSIVANALMPGGGMVLGLLDDVVFAVADIGAGKDAGQVLLGLGKKVVSTGVSAGIGAVYGGLGETLATQTTGLGRVVGTTVLNVHQEVVTNAAVGAINAVELGEGGLRWNAEAFKESVVGKDALIGYAAGVVQTATVGLLDLGTYGVLDDGRGRKWRTWSSQLHGIVGGLAGNLTRYAMGGEMVFNVLDFYDLTGLSVEGDDGKKREVHMGLFEVHIGRGGVYGQIGSGGVNVGWGRVAQAVRGLEVWRQNLRIWGSGHFGDEAVGMRMNWSAGDEEGRRLYEDVIAGRAVIEYVEGVGEGEVAETVWEDGVRVIKVAKGKVEGLGFGVVLAHEAHRDGVVGSAEAQQEETLRAALAHMRMGGLVLSQYGEGALEGRMKEEAEAYLEGDVLRLMGYASQYEWRGDYWLLKRDGTMVNDGEGWLKVEVGDGDVKYVTWRDGKVVLTDEVVERRYDTRRIREGTVGARGVETGLLNILFGMTSGGGYGAFSHEQKELVQKVMIGGGMLHDGAEEIEERRWTGEVTLHELYGIPVWETLTEVNRGKEIGVDALMGALKGGYLWVLEQVNGGEGALGGYIGEEVLGRYAGVKGEAVPEEWWHDQQVLEAVYGFPRPSLCNAVSELWVTDQLVRLLDPAEAGYSFDELSRILRPGNGGIDEKGNASPNKFVPVVLREDGITWLTYEGYTSPGGAYLTDPSLVWENGKTWLPVIKKWKNEDSDTYHFNVLFPDGGVGEPWIGWTGGGYGLEELRVIEFGFDPLEYGRSHAPYAYYY
ncbi:hypothetical protein STHERM_c20200 [Spirochaeta thermophila DSM 6192]|uniref:Uncharacterized protein n=1 Tax=Winmispira thermophila (strain ATCC 49972 / DSM 6192 / RI 19.B1) TaxID=665571 RepID=E0RQH9_WINT6|nr:hypothetical protein STHERM_c20200 [Spirochaeta thermophila DSM 6192]